MSENLDMLWSKVKDLKHDAQRMTDNKNIHGLINDLIDEIEVALSEEEYDDYEDNDNIYDSHDGDDNVVDFMMEDD